MGSVIDAAIAVMDLHNDTMECGNLPRAKDHKF
jgi:hypothetical protein